MYGAQTQDQKFQISNTGIGTIDWTIDENSGWLSVSPTSGSGDGSITVSINPAGLATGYYTASIQVDALNAFNSPQFVNINLDIKTLANSSPPFGAFDTPIDGTAGVRGAIPVTGWVLDDIEALAVKIYREPGGGIVSTEESDLIYVGDVVFVDGARPDVEQAYPNYPLHYRAGWGYMLLTNSLPSQGNGTFRLHAVAYDKDGLSVNLGARTIHCDNINAVKPFGSIDEPAQGAQVSGSSWVFGWVLTPQPNFIPTAGTTINMWVDGLTIGHPVYNQFRADIAALFPDYANSNGAVGSFLLDTTSYENGVHTLSWSARDSAGNSDGIGSRFFTIQNFSGTTTQVSEMGVASYREDETGRLSINIVGDTEIEIEELKRIEIKLEGKGGWMYIGWGEKKSKPLPIGSTLDEEQGIFYWQPGPGFLKQHILHFAVTDGMYMSKPVRIVVNIVPKRFFRSREKKRNKNF